MANISFPELEKEVLKFWEKQNIFQKSLKKDSPQGEFIFYEGPPTANGKPGIHHVLARAFKDLIPRYKTMQGFHVKRKAGWDTHGLPVELQVEKSLGISGKPEIEKLKTNESESIKYFNAQCQHSVWQHKEDWEKLTKRMGFWIDLNDPYVTYKNDYIETLWWIVKQIHDKGLLYKGHKVVPHCPRCGTALSSHEVAQGYKEVTEDSVFMKFKVKPGQKIGGIDIKDNTYILSWTTTPWTLPGNVALAVGKKVKYAGIRVNGVDGLLILAEDLVDKVFLSEEIEKVHVYEGSELIGLEYEPLFLGAIDSDTDNFTNAFKVYNADFVTTEDGTGVVHTAVMYGEDDYNLGDFVGLPKYHTVDEEGNFKFNLPAQAGMANGKFRILNDLQGKFVKDKQTENIIINYLEEDNLLLKSQSYKHDYPFCWRCDTPLLYYAKDSWFIKMSNLREELKANNENINWVPKHIKQGRFGEWLDGVKDWALSRERFWGTPLPVWQCGQCVNIKVIGSRNELKIFFPDLPADINLHKPFIDEVKFSCDKCDGMMTRDASVLDCWFDSGSMPFAQIHYPFENKDLVDEGKWYPADFICEAIDQTRGWFYTLLAISTLLTKQAPYKNVICLGLINDKKGKKMSKSKGNIVDPWEVMEKFGVDALRFYFYTMNQPGEPKNFDTRGVEEVLKKNWLILWNILSFYKIYVNTEGESKEHQDLDMNNLDIKDKWILLKQAELIKAVTEYLDKYDITTAARSIGEFINELSTWYVRRSRERFKNGGQDAYQAVETLGSVLLNLAKLLAPFAPFVAERLYLELINDCPVKHKEFKESVHLEQWPMVNQKTQEHLSVLEQMKKVRQIIEKALSLRAEAKMKVRQPLKSLTIIDKELDDQYIEIIKSEINVKAVILGGGEIALDTKLNQGLILEGALREIIRTVNSLRKQAKLTINDQIELYIDGEGDMTQQLLDKYEDDLKNGVLANTIVNKRKKLIHQKEVKVGNSTIWVGFSNP